MDQALYLLILLISGYINCPEPKSNSSFGTLIPITSSSNRANIPVIDMVCEWDEIVQIHIIDNRYTAHSVFYFIKNEEVITSFTQWLPFEKFCYINQLDDKITLNIEQPYQHISIWVGKDQVGLESIDRTYIHICKKYYYRQYNLKLSKIDEQIGIIKKAPIFKTKYSQSEFFELHRCVTQKEFRNYIIDKYILD